MAKYKLLADQWDQVLSKPTEPFRFVRHRKGAIVELTGADESRLLRIGAVEPIKRAASKSTKTEQTPPPEKPKSDSGSGDGDPGDGVGQHSGSGDGEGAPTGDGTTTGGPAGSTITDGSAEGTVDKPAKTAPVAAWRAYAVAQGHNADEAEAATRPDLIALYG